ncbi:MAG TPA: S1 RNA-binding domain-containing protein, partial [Polyangia bacterium]
MHDLTSDPKPESTSETAPPTEGEAAPAAPPPAAAPSRPPVTAAADEPEDDGPSPGNERLPEDDGPSPGNERLPEDTAALEALEEQPIDVQPLEGDAPHHDKGGKEKKPARRNPRLRALEEAFKNQTPVEGLVKSTNKGGLEVDLAGVRAFCPLSQIELRFCHDPTPYVGQRLRFKVIKFESARNIVLSRKVVLSAENASKAGDTKAKLSAGTRMNGRVTSLVDYGAFVDLGGVTGLVHISEISHTRVAHPKEALKVGQDVEVLVLAVEHPEGRKEAKVSLSIKVLTEDPWSRAAALTPGQTVHGTVMRLKSFGAFVELWAGVDGLIHNTNLADPPPEEPGQVVQPGQEVDATVISVDVEKRRIGLSLVGMRDPVAMPEGGGDRRPRGPRRDRAEGTRLQVGQVVTGQVDHVEPFGVFLRIAGGGRGLIPNAEMGTAPGTDHKKHFPEGTEIKAQVIEIGERGRIRLSKKGAENAEERAAYSGYVQAQPQAGSLGTFADLLRA